MDSLNISQQKPYSYRVLLFPDTKDYENVRMLVV